MRHLFIFILAAVCLAACAESAGPAYYQQPGVSSPPGLSLAEQAAFAATTSAINNQAQATYQAGIAQATREAAQATGQAQAVANATAGQLAAEQRATAGAATATIEALAVRQTEAVMQTQATWSAVANNATATAVAGLGQFDSARLAAEATRLAWENEQAAAEAERAHHWAAFVRWLPWVLLALLLLVGAAVWTFIRQQARPIVVTVNGRQELLGNPHYLARVVVSRPEPLALPAPVAADCRPIELPPMRRGHVLIAGETGSGKTTALQAILRRRQNVVVLDPHAAPGAWGSSAKVIGGGRDFEGIAAFMTQMRGLLSQRYHERAAGHTHFDPVTVATDEMPAIVGAIGPEVAALWREWVREGRKVGLFFVVSTQSTRVKTLGIEGESDLLAACRKRGCSRDLAIA